MTIGTWDPDADQAHISPEQLKAALAYTDPETVPTQAPAELMPIQALMKSQRSVWQPLLAPLSSPDLGELCRFFTLAEARWADWFGGDKNPVIWIYKDLKARGDMPDKALALWIKAHSENRFLPHGNLLG
jgi:hypothetical protein